jgi:hypothetical protein
MDNPIIKIRVPDEAIRSKIFSIRGKNVMVDWDLAELYGVKTKALNQAVKRNQNRFPEDFMFRLNKMEKNELVTICDRFMEMKHSASLPYAFTENGVAMLSSILNSERAVLVNIHIMRTFTRMREALASHKEILARLEHLEKKHGAHDRQIAEIFKAIKSIMELPVTLRRKTKQIGFMPPERK